MTSRLSRALFATLLFVAVGCGGDGPTGSGGELGPMSAEIDGDIWSASAPLATKPLTSGHVVAVSGVGNGQTIAFAFQWFQGTSTYTIGSGPANANLYIGTEAWRAPADGTVGNPDGTSGTITITALTDERITGEFEFTMKAAVTGTVPEMRVVANGKFDVPFST